jgi:hypothetical protein
VEVRLELGKRNTLFNGNAVVDHMKIRSPKIDNALTERVLYVCIFDVPFLWYSPVERLCPSRDIVNFYWYVLANNMKCLPNSIAGYAPANRIELTH